LKLHLDTDFAGDPDDAGALALVLAAAASGADVQLTGITTVADTDGRRAGYVRRLLELGGLPAGAVPVAAGAGWSLTDGSEMGAIPDHERFWGGPDVEPTFVDPATAIGVLDRSIAAGATICTIGPLTNLALLEAARPGRLADARVVCMGGWVRPLKPGLPEWDAARDFNIQCDPQAATTVFAGAGDLTLVTLGATVQTHLRERDLVRLEAAGALGRLLARMTRAHGEQYDLAGLAAGHRLLPDDLRNFHHDPLAVAVALGWPHGLAERMRLRAAATDDGALWFEPVDRSGGDLGDRIRHLDVIERPEAPPERPDRIVRVVDDVDGPGFVEAWLEAVEAFSRSRDGLAGTA
jgi:inosine-uridine nucleoside N-ribohydrolase